MKELNDYIILKYGVYCYICFREDKYVIVFLVFEFVFIVNFKFDVYFYFELGMYLQIRFMKYQESLG